jgi:hypothetical protein
MHKKKYPIVEHVFLINEDGRLISYVSLKGDGYSDEEFVSGLITATMNLLTDALTKKSDIKEDISQYKFEFGERNVILETGSHFFIALVILGMEDNALLDKSKAIIRDIDENYGDVFTEWSGNMKDFNGIDEIIMPLLPLEELSETEREKIKDEGFLKKVHNLWAMMYED